MLNLVKYSLIPITLIGILGCGGGSSSDSGVDVIVERGPVYAAIVKDADGQIAKDNQTNVYTFKTQPKYPITASPSKNSFIDVDADAKPSEGDTYFKEPLRSCTNEITSISNYIYTQTKCDKQKMDQAYKTLSSSLNADENELKKVPTQMKSVKAIVAANAIYSLTNEESAFILPGKVINLDKGDITLERIKKKAEQIEIYIGTLTDPSKIEAMVLKEDKIPTFNQATADNIKKNITTKPTPTPETKPKPTPGTTPTGVNIAYKDFDQTGIWTCTSKIIVPDTLTYQGKTYAHDGSCNSLVGETKDETTVIGYTAKGNPKFKIANISDISIYLDISSTPGVSRCVTVNETSAVAYTGTDQEDDENAEDALNKWNKKHCGINEDGDHMCEEIKTISHDEYIYTSEMTALSSKHVDVCKRK